MASIDVSSQRASLLADEKAVEQLPAELLVIIRNHASTNLLDAVSQAALIPQLTGRIFAHFEQVFPDICARWILHTPSLVSRVDTLASFARILRFAPYLSTFIRSYLSKASSPAFPDAPPARVLEYPDSANLTHVEAGQLLRLLLAVWRLASFDLRRYSGLLPPSVLQPLFKHHDHAVRYLAVRIFCLQTHAADSKLEALIREHVGTTAPILGDFDGDEVDYGFLSLHEHARAEKILGLCQDVQEASLGDSVSIQHVPPQELTPLVACYGRVMLPRIPASTRTHSSLVMTPSTANNMESLAALLKDTRPILLHGLPGSGKTSLIQQFAKDFAKHAEMVTLHINEQTDAKMLVGLYSADSKPGSFQWRPGVLTTAVREGRWVLIEDLDRAPNEVISTLLPLIERGQLLIPSRGETVEAADGFRLFATVRTTRGMHGRETLPNLLGLRFWQQLSIQAPAESELLDIIGGTYPVLRKFAPDILSVYRRLTNAATGAARHTFGRSILDRQPSSRDLLRWCRRLASLLADATCKTGDEPITETTRDHMFMEAVDCFVSRIPDAKAREYLVFQIAEEWHMSKERVSHYLEAHIPPLEDSPDHFHIGRVRLRKKKNKDRLGKLAKKSSRPFANTTHAKKLLEQAAVAVRSGEPVLLVGETGIGKTTVVQQLADTLGHRLIAVNLSQQSEVGDLLGGFKPVNVRSLAVPLKEEFEDLFSATGISITKNQPYLERLGKTFARGDWARVSKQWREAPKMFAKIIAELEKREAEQKSASRNGNDANGQPAKRRKTESKLQRLLDLKPRWDAFSRSLDQFDVQLSGNAGAFAFSFVEGNIVKAARNGDWVLLDEVNLASPDTLESIAGLLTGPSETPSILLSETGEIERVKAHPNFRIFGAMNPATDVGKRDLPIGIRSRFTEIYVDSPDRDVKDLLTIVKTYLKGSGTRDDKAADDIARLYLDTKMRAEEKRLVDGANEVPHFSLRTLTRVLSYVNHMAAFYGLRRALYEGFSMGFLTLLNRESEKLLMPLIDHRLFGQVANPQSILSQPPKRPNDGKKYVRFVNKGKDRHYWLCQGDLEPVERPDYIITPYVERNLLNLVRATSTRRFPILIQGPTSAGKTSMIEYLANFTGNKFVRINNHEHTDLQEYLGTYVSDSSGKLRFQEGLLVQAMRRGHWIVLDELNLAPTDVLEALNRLLDDNRELLIPETQEVVRPHENFMLFATQNPPGLYGGRKALSRAFRNRFLELHYDDIPEEELEFILQQRSRNTSPSDCKRIVTVYKDLSRLRQTSRMFEQKDSFATLRDLFRWTQRDADNREQIAMHGFMLLAERVRVPEERMAVKEVIEKVFRVKIDTDKLYAPTALPGKVNSKPTQGGVVWTGAMRRLYILVDSALRNNEPVLLVGDTGCGKTTVCQLLAEARGQELHIVNAHQNTETGDLIGSQRPVRNRGAIADSLRTELAGVLHSVGQPSSGTLEELLERYHGLPAEVVCTIDASSRDRITSLETRSNALFEWADGSLVHAMKSGDFFLLDEISLADDSVLERLNSVLEPQRTLLLAEKGIDNSFVTATEGFQFLATMNPGGDFGKKELSPALRNRFTEIWVPALSETEDILEIVLSKLDRKLKSFASTIVEFASWFARAFRSSSTSAGYSIRDMLLWVKFINHFGHTDSNFAVVHGAATVFVDTLGANPSALVAMDPETMEAQRQRCLDKLSELLKCDATFIYRSQPAVSLDADKLSIGHFEIAREVGLAADPTFAFNAPTTKLNAMRVLRSLQMQKPILLEGSPGVGKTTLVAALARTCGRPLTRINLSDQTDLMDLFGTDMPVEGAEAGNFAWRDAPFLQAMQRGEWVLLDEMNLASQSVLEGLNACLDHRGEVYISELDQVFRKHPDFRLFAAQNPHHQGGGRKGLPSSFVNRFIVVYADVFTEEDLLLIAGHNYPNIPQDTIQRVIRFVTSLNHRVVVEKAFGSQGSPWEFNLRDILRWLDLMASQDVLLSTSSVDDFLGLVVRQRFRSVQDRRQVDELFADVFGRQPQEHSLYHDVSATVFQVGNALLPRSQLAQPLQPTGIDVVLRLPELESLMICVKQGIPCILSGSSGSGKSVLLQHVAAVAGKSLVVFPLNADIDTMDLVGGFEQSDPLREVNAALRFLYDGLERSVLSQLPGEVPPEALSLLHALNCYDSGVSQSLDQLSVSIQAVQSIVSPSSEVSSLLTTALAALAKPRVANDPRFEWLDGVIVRALETGQWLVLDNANLCNASVLDRLNSLLEPNGVLSINEHCGPDGEPRIIKPHPDFRIFLTVDPRHGELSRAMRNRAVEIHLGDLPTDMSLVSQHQHQTAEVESSLRRFRLSRDISVASYGRNSDCCPDVSALTLGNLSLNDASLASRYSGITSQVFSNISRPFSLDVYKMQLDELVFYLEAEETAGVRNITSELYSQLSRTGFRGITKAQPLSPLQNAPIVRILQQTAGDLPFWLNSCIEFLLELHRCQQALELQSKGAKAGKLASLNRLQRSVVSDRIAAVAKDSTAGVAKFLAAILQGAARFLRDNLKSSTHWKEQTRIIRSILDFWWRTLELVSRPVSESFEEARFQAHLGHGIKSVESLLSSIETDHNRDLAVGFLQAIRDAFTTGFMLRTGLSMEILWRLFKPAPIPSAESLHQNREIVRLADRFDGLRWKVRTSIPDLVNAMSTLVAAAEVVQSKQSTASHHLINDLSKEIDLLEASIGSVSKEREIIPFFVSEFKNLEQALLLQALSSPSSTQNVIASPDLMSLAVMSNQPTLDRIRLRGAAANPAQYLLSTGRLASQDTESHTWHGKLTSTLLARSKLMGTASLDSLRLLEAELPLLGRFIVNSSQQITDNPILALNRTLRQLILEVVSAHGLPSGGASASINEVYGHVRSDSTAALPNLTPEKFAQLSAQYHQTVVTEEWPAHLAAIAKDHLVPSMIAVAMSDSYAHLDNDEEGGLAPASYDRNAAACSSVAWVQFAVGYIKLYVPDKSFDPQLRPQFELEVYDETKTRLQHRLTSLLEFEFHFTGQGRHSLRAQLVKEDIEALGPAPAAGQMAHYRPAQSELGQVQADFNNLLKSVVDMDVASTHLRHTLGADSSGAEQELGLVKQNVNQIIDRLSKRFDAYQDMVTPAADALHCLQLGLSLTVGLDSLLQDESSTGPLMDVTPFVGGKLPDSSSTVLPTRSLQFLKYMGLVVSVEGLARIRASQREVLFESVHNFFSDWSKKLEADRKLEEAKTSLYRFRGSFEDEEEQDEAEFNELFPTFDEEEEDQKPPSSGQRAERVRDLSVKIAELHRNIFLEPQEALQSLRESCMAISREAASEASEKPAVSQRLNRRILPMAVWSLYEGQTALDVNAVGEGYNFYSDPNLPAVRQLISLVGKIEARFRDLQAVDEIGYMQPLADVLAACDNLLAMVHTEPLAKILPKLEHLHNIVYEWQHGGYAPSTYGAPALYSSLTDMIISWRREELKTWARLFDLEVQKCRDDASSWFFMAYQVVIAVPLSFFVNSGDPASQLRDYAVRLVKELEVYFSSSIVGQFSGRLSLLKQLQKHVELLVMDYPSMAIIRDALRNFIAFYGRFEAVIDEHIAQARAPIEKNVKNTVLLASWKDTNINALRESARKSHRSLFKLVRKFRAVLGQPAAPIVNQGLPDKEPVSGGGEDGAYQLPAAGKTDTHGQAVSRCQDAAPEWLLSHRRLSNLPKTLSVMSGMTEVTKKSWDASQETKSFLESLVSSIGELRKETPEYLTEENTDQVKHLKTRKRYLFADVLKTMRQMGFRHNLGMEALAKQESVATVLGSTPAYGHHLYDDSAAEHYFQKAVDIVAAARVAGHNHHEELTGAEVSRSLGYLEGMVQVLLGQRNTLITAQRSLDSLAESLVSARELSNCWDDNNSVAIERQPSNLAKVVRWIIPVLEFGTRLVEAHGKLGGVDNTEIMRALEKRAASFRTDVEKRNDLVAVPGKLKLASRESLDAEARLGLQQCAQELDAMVAARPDLSFLLLQIKAWTRLTVLQDAEDVEELVDDTDKFGSQMATLCDSVLVALQEYKQASSELPPSARTPAWLSGSSDVYASMLKALRMDTITRAIQDCMTAMGRLNLETRQIRKVSTSMLGIALPILEQYAVTCRQTAGRLYDLHWATGKMTHSLGRTFTQLASKGFCTPQEKSDETQGESGKLESGTGLGEGEGAEDISKDIQPDEDLSELAQEPNKDPSGGEMEDEKDAVDMADEDMEGELASVDGADEDEEEKDGKGDENNEEENDEMEEEAGEVDDLDPTAVDEKMWEGENEDEAEKDQQGDKAKGQKNKDEQVAAEGQQGKDEGEGDEPQEAGDDQGSEPDADEDVAAQQQDEDVQFQEDIKQDQNVQQEDALALPDEMELDLQDGESGSSDDDLDDLSDMEGNKDDLPEQKASDVEDEEDGEPEKGEQAGDSEEPDEEVDNLAGDEANDEPEPEPDQEEEVDEEGQDEGSQPDRPDEQQQEQPQHDTANADAENAAPSDVKGGGLDQNNTDSMELDDEFSNNAAQRDEGAAGDGSAQQQQASAGQDGTVSRSVEETQPPPSEQKEQDAQEAARRDPFKKLGDALERWHRRQADILEADAEQENKEPKQEIEGGGDGDMSRREFQHLQNDEDAADTQALGGASKDQVQPIDDTMAIDEDEDPSSRVMPDVEEDGTMEDHRDNNKMDMDDPDDAALDQDKKNQGPEREDARSGVKTRQGAYDRESPSPEDIPGQDEEEEEEEEEDDKDDRQEDAIDEPSAQLSETHLADEEMLVRDLTESMQLWSAFQNKTHPLSLSLTSQLRLILTPSQSTKLSGSFRTGKRLNIKKIIPYIASGYKRDKIWMRRAVPTKRSYQILLCVDDSRSMGESASGNLALESLVMVSRALSMLEVGQVGVLGFGADVFTAHDLADDPFAGHDAGARVLQRFRFEQDRTDVVLLLRRTIDSFREARARGGGSASSGGGGDLWQLALILSDGLTPSAAHDTIRRLLREAMEERIMVVFIVMDDSQHRKGDSVLDLKEAHFVKDAEGNSQVVIERYLDTFPFQYYLIVHNLEDLPNALAGLLRTWFAEVNS